MTTLPQTVASASELEAALDSVLSELSEIYATTSGRASLLNFVLEDLKGGNRWLRDLLAKAREASDPQASDTKERNRPASGAESEAHVSDGNSSEIDACASVESILAQARAIRGSEQASDGPRIGRGGSRHCRPPHGSGAASRGALRGSRGGDRGSARGGRRPPERSRRGTGSEAAATPEGGHRGGEGKRGAEPRS
eukprot:CAMPEP_0177608502 /NCGR_PEP_ID=MMETSP0419_2-20121207/18507_1 /TAXON_ID=582737 /ORGANISM="Tetraselmis sp., Strain GSL018" /LENGTH=195 /DNA_ID=CAMNT_0019103199 /DNA_START=275 /DNA_END=858 /DNA_ORIENTATION=-